MKASAFCFVAFLGLIGLAGCIDVNANVPDRIQLNGSPVYTAPPPAQIPAADPNSAADLRRENQQLRERIAYVQQRNEKLAKEDRKLLSDVEETNKDIAALTQQVERYQRALSQ
jgi:septal ring factor EnvC (AmiA/AmiB activator)